MENLITILKKRAKRAIHRRKISKLEADTIALEGFTQQFYLGESLTDREAVRNLENGTVEIIHSNGQHAANGLLITSHGYILTARHCANESMGNSRMIRLSTGEVLTIDKICAVGNKDDIVLIKANKQGEVSSETYRFHDTRNLWLGIPTAILTRWNGKLEEAEGHVRNSQTNTIQKSNRRNERKYAKHFDLACSTVGGDSGGVVATRTDSRILGFVAGGTYDGRYTSAVKLHSALELVSFYVQDLKERITRFS